MNRLRLVASTLPLKPDLQRQSAGAQDQWRTAGVQFSKDIEPTHIALIDTTFDLEGK